jgi:hypothetical protein
MAHSPAGEYGRGAVELAEAVAEACAEPSSFHRLDPDEFPLVDKVDVIAGEMYGADGLHLSPLAARQLDKFERAGFGSLPVCIAKTHQSLSADPKIKGAPTGWRLPVREVRASIGAGVHLSHLRRHAHHSWSLVHPQPNASTSMTTARSSGCPDRRTLPGTSGFSMKPSPPTNRQ